MGQANVVADEVCRGRLGEQNSHEKQGPELDPAPQHESHVMKL
jgi:hypothetical protein